MKLEPLVVTAFASLGMVAAPARACGVSASGVASCSLSEHLEELRSHWALGVSSLYTSTALRFSGSLRAPETRYAALAALAYLPTPRWVLQAGMGATFGGALRLPDGKHEFAPGPAASVGADYRFFDDGRWFALATSVLSFSTAATRLSGSPVVHYEAFDVRIGAQFGLDIADTLQPYAAARVFGGPVFWHYAGEAVTGTDTHHYQLGAGLGVRLSRHLNAYAEGIPLGERAVSFGVGILL